MVRLARGGGKSLAVERDGQCQVSGVIKPFRVHNIPLQSQGLGRGERNHSDIRSGARRSWPEEIPLKRSRRKNFLSGLRELELWGGVVGKLTSRQARDLLSAL